MRNCGEKFLNTNCSKRLAKFSKCFCAEPSGFKRYTCIESECEIQPTSEYSPQYIWWIKNRTRIEILLLIQQWLLMGLQSDQKTNILCFLEHQQRKGMIHSHQPQEPDIYHIFPQFISVSTWNINVMSLMTLYSL